ncbi:hypothetical protein [Streptomyces sp. NPDC001537]
MFHCSQRPKKRKAADDAPDKNGMRPCDFCTHPIAAWSYPCRTFTRQVVALYRAAANPPVTAAADTVVAAALAPLWTQFRARRSGPADRIGGAS